MKNATAVAGLSITLLAANLTAQERGSVPSANQQNALARDLLRESGYPFHSACPNRLWGGFGVLDHRVIGGGWRVHGLLHEPVEELRLRQRIKVATQVSE
jgi:hypothetical protein